MVETAVPMQLVAPQFQQAGVIMLRVAQEYQVIPLVVVAIRNLAVQCQVIVAALHQRVVRYHPAHAVAAPAVAHQAALSQAAVAVPLQRVAAAHAAVAAVLHAALAAAPAAAPLVLVRVDNLGGCYWRIE